MPSMIPLSLLLAVALAAGAGCTASGEKTASGSDPSTAAAPAPVTASSALTSVIAVDPGAESDAFLDVADAIDGLRQLGELTEAFYATPSRAAGQSRVIDLAVLPRASGLLQITPDGEGRWLARALSPCTLHLVRSRRPFVLVQGTFAVARDEDGRLRLGSTAGASDPAIVVAGIRRPHVTIRGGLAWRQLPADADGTRTDLLNINLACEIAPGADAADGLRSLSVRIDATGLSIAVRGAGAPLIGGTIYVRIASRHDDPARDRDLLLAYPPLAGG